MHLRTWFSGGLGSAQLTTGVNDFKGLFQSDQLYEKAQENEKKFLLIVLFSFELQTFTTF